MRKRNPELLRQKLMDRFPLTTTIMQNKENPEPVEVIAQAVLDVSEAFRKIKASRLNETALIVLLKDYTGLPARDIKKVLEACRNLSAAYTNLPDRLPHK